MLEETKDIVFANIDFLPLKSYTNIVKEMLKIDWETIVPKDKLSYIIGNPPCIGHHRSTHTENLKLNPYLKADEFGKPYRLSGKIDYVAGWYFLKPRSWYKY